MSSNLCERKILRRWWTSRRWAQMRPHKSQRPTAHGGSSLLPPMLAPSQLVLATSLLAPLGRLRAGLPTRMVSAPPVLGTDSTDLAKLADAAMEPAPPSPPRCLMLSPSCATQSCSMHKSHERSLSSLSCASVCCALPPAPESAVISSHSSARKPERGGTVREERGGKRRGRRGIPSNEAGGSKHKHKHKSTMQHASAPRSAGVLNGLACVSAAAS